MKAIVCEKLTGPGDLVLSDWPEPEPSPTQVLVHVRAWGLNFADALMAKGEYQTHASPPFVLGCELSGQIVAMGSEVTAFRIGDRIAALAPGGGFAETAAIEQHRAMPVASGMTDAAAAGFYSGYTTAYHALHQRGHIQPGETLLVLAAGGGTGMAAIDLGVAAGARVIGVAGSEEKLEHARARGAEAINYRTADFGAELARLTDGAGVDLVFDPVGGDLFDLACRHVRWNGRYLVIGFASGRIPSLRANLPLVKGYALVGVFTDDFMWREPEASRANVAALNALHDAGLLNPQIHSVVGIEHIPRLLTAVEAGEMLGKTVVVRT